MPSPSAPTGHYDRQDLVNYLLATSLQTRATIKTVLHAVVVSPPDQPQAAADLIDAAAALLRIEQALLRAAGPADEPSARVPATRSEKGGSEEHAGDPRQQR